MRDEYRFLNPYNFVRYLPPGRESDEPAIKLLGRCHPPPHDRFIGLTGEIKCELEAATPIFISDSECVEEDGSNEHKLYRFFRLINEEGKEDFAIPSTSLRGMLRSVFEAATNSCFSVFEGEKRLSYHLQARDARNLVPGRIEKNENEKWVLRLLPGTTKYNPSGPKSKDCLYAAWIKIYDPMRESATKRQSPNTPYTNRSNVLPEGIKHGDECFALLEKMEHPARKKKGKYFGRFYFWNVKAIRKNKNELPKSINNYERIEKGFLCVNYQNIENKHDERFFFININNNSVSKTIEMDEDILRKYQALIEDYKERHRDNIEQIRKKGRVPSVPNGDKAAYSRFILEDEKDLNGELVYAMLGGKTTDPTVRFIAPVTVPRVAYNTIIGKLLPPHLRPCSYYESLCPACRVFGWVHQNPPKGDEKVAYAGRVRISHAEIIENNGTLPELPLAILSAPKPTTTSFYLLKNGRADPHVVYDANGAELRGRKFYRHQEEAEEQEYERTENVKDKQNRTIRDALSPSAKFKFAIRFENLSAVELGALLWSIEMEKGMYHKLGLAKPLGFGSTKIHIKNINVLNFKERYDSFTSNGWGGITDPEKTEWLSLFKEAMKNRYGKPFEELNNIKDIKAILSISPSDLPVHYPRSSEDPEVSGENFRWFMKNKIPLKIASEDVEGFSL